MFIASEWKDYEVLDTGDGEKLERWKDIVLRRPDPQAIWPKQRPELWTQADAHYHRSREGRRRVGVFPQTARALDGDVRRAGILCAAHRLQAHRPVSRSRR